MILFDLETDGLDYTKIHCMAWYDDETKTRGFFTDEEAMVTFINDNIDKSWCAHNGCGFDWWVISDVLGIDLPRNSFIDTSVWSKLQNYNKFSTHSLKEMGKYLGELKEDYETDDWSVYTEDMGTYCQQDVTVLKAIVRYLNKGKVSRNALILEHKIAFFCAEMNRGGFKFNKPKAQELLGQALTLKSMLEEDMYKAWPPELAESRRIKLRVTKDGKLYKSCQDAMDDAPKWKRDYEREEIVLYDYKEFNPASPKDRIDKLWEAGWKPYVKTAGHKKFLRGPDHSNPEKRKHFERYGWSCNADNLATLPKDAPDAARDLEAWLTIEGRRSSLVEWIEICDDDGFIHPKFWHIGAWTQRMSHSSPNSANIPSVWPEGLDAVSPSDKIKRKYNGEMRALFEADPGAYLVGCDADGIQLRVLAHYMKSEEYVKAILEGSKEDGTDIHSLNQKALGPICKSRDQAKTFIYAWLLGAGIPKIASILNCTIPAARKAVEDFLESLPELRKLKNITIPVFARRGGFEGLDGRWITCDSEHLMLAGMLQAGEAVIMKKATTIWKHRLDYDGYMYRPVNFVHDEWQTVVWGGEEQAHSVGSIQSDALSLAGDQLKLFCPISGSYTVGKNWKETH